MAILDALGNAFQGMGCRSRQVDKSEDKYEDELDGDSYIFLGGDHESFQRNVSNNIGKKRNPRWKFE